MNMKRLFKLPLRRDRVMSDVGDELDFHLQGRIDELIASGMSREDAEREARARFGDRTKVEAEVESIDLTTLQRQKVSERLAAMWRDTRYAARGLARKPLYTCAAVLTLALAIGANTTIFSVFDAVLLHPFPLPNLRQLVVVHDDFPLMNLRTTGTSALEGLDLFERKDLFSVSASSTSDAAVIDVGDTPTRVSGTATIGDFWGITGARPLHGRLYRAEDSKVGAPAVIVLSHRLWQQISGDSTIVGKTIRLIDRTEKSYEVIGVLPRDFNYPRNASYWRPAVLDSNVLDNKNSRGTIVYAFIGQRRKDVPLEVLNARLAALADDWHRMYTDNYKNGGHTMFARPFTDWQAGTLKPIVIALFGAVMFVLLIACANIAGLQLVRTTSRARELAVRAALGAGRGAIARQIVLESTIIALAGGVIGLVIGKAGLLLLAKANVAQFPALRSLSINGYVLGFTAAAIILAGIVFGIAPTLKAARTDVNDALRDSGRGASGGIARHHFLRASVVLQNALVLVLLIGAGLTVRSLDRLLGVDLGFNPDGIATFGAPLPASRYSGEAKLAFYRTLNERLRKVPGVQSVGFASGVPFTSNGGSTSYTLEGVPARPDEPQRHANQAFVYGDYFRTMGIQITQGRDFAESDQTTGEQTRIVDETLVRRSFRDGNPIGALITHGPGPAPIIGVVKPVKAFGLDEEPHPLVYHDYGHRAGNIGSLSIVVRSTLTPGELTRAARAIIADLDPRIPVDAARSMNERIDFTVGAKRLARNVLAGFAALALILALLGLYAVMSYVVNQRTREIGIRVALGAQQRQVAGMVLRDGAILAVIGLVVGAVAFVSLGRIARSLVYGIGVFDPVTISAAIILLGVITVFACWFPARRAVRIDPVVTLRAD
jgi:putative ABC transport system permease protein